MSRNHTLSSTRKIQYSCLALFAVAVLLLVYLANARVNANGAAAGATPRPIPTQNEPDTVTYAAIGDSVTAGNSPDFSNKQVGDLSWVDHVPADQATFVGGWSVGGATTATMADNAASYGADVLVVLAGTNDSGQGIPFEDSAVNYDRIVAAAGSMRVVVSSIPPRDDNPAIATEYNNQLAALAADRGWAFIDASAGLRSGDRYSDGLTTDGIHPTEQGAEILGGALTSAILG